MMNPTINKKEQARKLLDRIKVLERAGDPVKSMYDLGTRLKDDVSIKLIKKVDAKLNSFKKIYDFKPLIEGLADIQTTINEDKEILSTQIQTSIKEVKTALAKLENQTISVGQFNKELSELEKQITLFEKIFVTKEVYVPVVKKVKELESKVTSVGETFKKFTQNNENAKKDTIVSHEALTQKLTGVVESIEDTKKDIYLLKQRRNTGGGNANRNIAIGGNYSVLSKYTDINLKAGNNVTITYSNNNTTKYTDITIAATGGAASVGGMVRSINRIATSQTAGNTTGTDYVYICTAGVNLTLPNAIGITNLYTVKNVANSSVLVSTTGGQTIDDDTSALLATKYTEITLHNSGDDNWNVGV